MRFHTFRPAALAALLLGAATLAACETTGGPAPQAAAAPPKPLTHQEASLQCWMATEKDAARMSLDQRADIVTACIDRKMKGEPDALPAATAAAKPAASPMPKPKPQS